MSIIGLHYYNIMHAKVILTEQNVWLIIYIYISKRTKVKCMKNINITGWMLHLARNNYFINRDFLVLKGNLYTYKTLITLIVCLFVCLRPCIRILDTEWLL